MRFSVACARTSPSCAEIEPSNLNHFAGRVVVCGKLAAGVSKQVVVNGFLDSFFADRKPVLNLANF